MREHCNAQAKAAPKCGAIYAALDQAGKARQRPRQERPDRRAFDQRHHFKVECALRLIHLPNEGELRMTAYQSYLDAHQGRFLEELLDFLRIPSISALPERAQDVARAGDWVAQRLTAAGVENVEKLPTGGHPVVCGDWLHAPGGRRS